ncbi:nucleotidyl transferase AbiEii/AbiGii toxin family protein [Pantoea sp. JK]|uniref:nucleotidyl transferase AbiEii/AbiGii toxin family protein n=1 Tax=Pantoea sp. JK TaxID=2871703 RepID=UPI0022373EDB|nr:nucleotidyl transferase AbiEii/AbiGii toxin family protein [Pantoea sp. JK]MCW6034639.1 nucleotidyl transferase AbiEii/AbiGii toxin family protein [Pantoea sp. JK]
MKDTYRKQVQLLLDVLPEVAKEACFAMHGGTAINLFYRDMPRLSVDIDLTYVPIADRAESLVGINQALQRIQQNIYALRGSIQVQHRADVCKLQVTENEVLIKLEVNMVGRGLIADSVKMPLCEMAQEAFDAFCAIPVVAKSQLFGGKLCAALDRQHPRDLFDVKLLLDNDGFTDDIKRGLIYGLASSTRPMYEMLDPNLQDQRSAFENQFIGMSDIPFSYADYEQTRDELIRIIRASLTSEDKAFLLSFNRLEPDWTIYNFEEFPSVKWKLLNLETFRKKSLSEWQLQNDKLEAVFKL